MFFGGIVTAYTRTGPLRNPGEKGELAYTLLYANRQMQNYACNFTLNKPSLLFEGLLVSPRVSRIKIPCSKGAVCRETGWRLWGGWTPFWTRLNAVCRVVGYSLWRR
jgi:hypothetical protein